MKFYFFVSPNVLMKPWLIVCKPPVKYKYFYCNGLQHVMISEVQEFISSFVYDRNKSEIMYGNNYKLKHK
jgi:hypothetical protein